MTRTPVLKPDDMDGEQRAIYDAIFASRGVWLNGPFSPMLHQPKIADPVQKLGAFVRYHTSLEPALTELAILIVARHHDCQFEWYQHYPIALAAGVAPDVAEAIRLGHGVTPPDERSAIVYEFTRALLERNRIPDREYDSARDAFGVVGVVELTALIGYYGFIAHTLNAHEVSMPAGADLPLPDLDRWAANSVKSAIP
jgi:4-carboxymuconolactone decarboxylase